MISRSDCPTRASYGVTLNARRGSPCLWLLNVTMTHKERPYKGLARLIRNTGAYSTTSKWSRYRIVPFKYEKSGLKGFTG